MEPIPINSQTMPLPFDSETYINLLKDIEREREEKLKRLKEKNKRDKQLRKLQKPFYDELVKLRKEELERLLQSDKKFIKRCEESKKNGHLTKDYYEKQLKESGRCGGYYEITIDLVLEYSSKEYKNKRNELLDKINNIKLDD